ncbi:hypothetical protein [Frigoriflavimonas asaccharolytica]|uniref:GLPGLI family protein n=1 Tax=Frigoriflavimonas asaccharolytica TaxID=2735899 RepID=A0A8J8K6S3_9FLAO|nr:hypothetical protein [Frigoriflavimonas asaccharolytica]NRS91263.1 hypothetical protein [Frigoriflavimonas asaccharolytica]
MKKLILLFTILFSVSAFSQIKILKNDALTEVGKDNSVSLYKKDKKYTFNYQDVANANLNSFRSFYFYDLNKDFDQLYKLISDGFIDMPTSEIEMELPQDIIGLNYGRNYGQITVQFVHYIGKNRKYVGKSQFLTKKQVDKIFGKDKKASSTTSTSTGGSFTGFAGNEETKTVEKAAIVENVASAAATKKTVKKTVKKSTKK